MSTLFPPEIEAEILLRLPAKSLQRFKSVCKTWRILITSDPIFIATFYRRSSQNPKLLFLKHPRESLFPIHFSVASQRPIPLVEATTLPLPHSVVSIEPGNEDDHELKPTRVELINSNSINGVLGIVVYMGLSNGPVDFRCDMYVWNPSTGETVRMPKSEVSGLFDGPPMVKFYAGFGYDKEAVDYKVVRVVYVGSLKAKREVYSMRGNCWKELTFGSGISSNTLWASEMCTFVDGAGYWGVYTKEEKDKFSVLGFDFGLERFKRVRVPPGCVDGRERKYHSLWEYRGVLALSVLHFGGFESSSTRHYIWLFRQRDPGDSLSKSSWSALFNIDLECGPRRPVVSLRSGELVLLGEDDGEHVLYDPAGEQVRRLGISDVDHVVLHLESLVSPSSLLPKEASSSLDC